MRILLRGCNHGEKKVDEPKAKGQPYVHGWTEVCVLDMCTGELRSVFWICVRVNCKVTLKMRASISHIRHAITSTSPTCLKPNPHLINTGFPFWQSCMWWSLTLTWITGSSAQKVQGLICYRYTGTVIEVKMTKCCIDVYTSLTEIFCIHVHISLPQKIFRWFKCTFSVFVFYARVMGKRNLPEAAKYVVWNLLSERQLPQNCLNISIVLHH